MFPHTGAGVVGTSNGASAHAGNCETGKSKGGGKGGEGGGGGGGDEEGKGGIVYRDSNLTGVGALAWPYGHC